MQMASECPSAEMLQQLLLGYGNDATADLWEQHLTICPKCTTLAKELQSDDELVRQIRDSAQLKQTPEPEIVSTLISVFRQLMPEGNPATSSWFGSADTTDYLAAPSAPGEIGRLGPYTINEILGAGGMGVVYRGYDPRLERSIAVKIIRPNLLDDNSIKIRFLAEARAAAAVEHDHIVGVYSIEEHDGISCITMPLLEGETLEKRMRQQKAPLGAVEIVRIATELLSGLQAAHERGLIHRDIKPGNLWLEHPTDRLKILDFGLAMPLNGDGDSRFAGTPGYMAPEQAHGQHIDGRADLFSVGCVLYHISTSQRPFPADTPVGMIVRTLTSSPPPIGELNPKLPAPLTSWIDSLLAKEPQNRPASTEAALQQLQSITAAMVRRQARITRRRWIAGVAAAGVIGTISAWGLFQANQPRPAVPVTITFHADSDVGTVILSRDGIEERFDPSREKDQLLAPGDYQIRAVKSRNNRNLFPQTLVVLPKEPKTISLALVGQEAMTKAHSSIVTGIAVITKGDSYTVLSSSLDRTLGSWEPGSKEAPKFVNLDSPALCLSATSDGSVVATAGGNKRQPFDLDVHLFNGRTLQKRGQLLQGHTRRVSTLALSPDGKQLVSSAFAELLLWDIAKGTSDILEGHRDCEVRAIVFDPNRKQILTGDEEGFLFLWDLEQVKFLRKMNAMTTGSTGGVTAIAFLQNGFLTTGDDGVIRLWDRDTFTPREVNRVKKGTVLRSLAVSKDDKRLLSGGDDGCVRLWSLPDGALLHEFKGHTKAVSGVLFTPNERSAISSSEDHSIRLWRLPY
ncbi:MAG: serine/threonine-protein kinase [Zavarzinella sp.]